MTDIQKLLGHNEKAKYKRIYVKKNKIKEDMHVSALCAKKIQYD